MSRRPPYAIFSLLLQYPDDELLAARPGIGTAIATLPRSRERESLNAFWQHFGTAGGIQLQQEYVETFDLQRRSSLYLTFYSDGDTRKRGQALLRLKRLYKDAGMELSAGELPDFLPVMLEFAEHAPGDIGPRLLSEHRAGIELIRRHLSETGNSYRHLLDGISAGLPSLRRADLDAIGRLLREGPPSEQVGLQPFAPPEVVPVDASR